MAVRNHYEDPIVMERPEPKVLVPGLRQHTTLTKAQMAARQERDRKEAVLLPLAEPYHFNQQLAFGILSYLSQNTGCSRLAADEFNVPRRAVQILEIQSKDILGVFQFARNLADGIQAEGFQEILAMLEGGVMVEEPS